MPVMRPCMEPDCGALVRMPNRRCARHQRQAKRTSRGGGSREWRELRSRVLQRDGYRCSNCGSSGPLTVHHQDGDHKNNSMPNLITLCHDCHTDRHREMRKAPRHKRKGTSNG